jgi:hypothetical protein
VARFGAGALPCQEAGPDTTRHVVTPELSRAGRGGWSRGARGSTKALPHGEVGLVPWDA